ncbi:MAG TPA: XrtN system VIT domain-containing protein [Chitinophagaceae bacterium]|nr:XrtN system VIT domain-containing protein [Chitinophagaceae bacterium]
MGIQSIRAKAGESLYVIGLALIVMSLGLFCIPIIAPAAGDNTFSIFFVNFLLTALYFLMVLFSGRLRKGRGGLYPMFLFLVLFLISAYALNREMNVFDNSAGWFAVVLVLACINYIMLVFLEDLPRWAQHLLCFIAGVSLMVFLYLAIYLIPLYVVGAVAAIALGFSLHTFVPALFVIYTIVFLRKATRINRQYHISFWTGAGFVLVLAIVFVAWWGVVLSGINTTYRRASLVEEHGLPAWIAVSQQAPRNAISEKILKTGLVYSVPRLEIDGMLWRVPSRSFGEEKKHDPLVMMAAFLAGQPDMPEEQRIKVLEAMYDSRHQAQERLWKGDDLYTQQVNTNIRLWPELHLAYTEKSITVTSSAFRNFWPDRQEAIYTFHLPEGAVVTSLSLWINGREEKGILTSKEKADTAYKTIVGVEQRDPSVVHWQEGNTVSVRVFPVLSRESRLFRIGITAPLEKWHDQLLYRNIYFDGPPAAAATENITIDLGRPLNNLEIPSFLHTVNGQLLSATGRYHADWKMAFTDGGLVKNGFSFDNRQYTMAPYEAVREAMTVNDVYLDINNSWTKKEFRDTWELVKDKKVFAFSNRDGMVQLNENNRDNLFGQLSGYQFSLFPLYKITDAAHALLISKSGAASPSMGDLQQSGFRKKLQDYIAAGNKVRLFDLGEGLSPYLKALKEFRAFRYEQGDVHALKALLDKKYFAGNIENDQQVVVESAGVVITSSEGTGPATAPDHLMRLFSYNHIMQKTGMQLLADSTVNAGMVAEAQKAYIVSPVSSLVVLEKKEDYDRFNIEDSKNSLKNATLHEKGAVPEPHEWALLLVAVGTLLYAKYRQRFAKTNTRLHDGHL